MKTFKKAMAVLLSLVMFMSFLTIHSSAKYVSYEEWVEYYKTCDNKGMMMTPGSDETELNFCWHSDRNWTGAKPVVRMSKSADMSNYVEFKGYHTFSEQADQRVNNVTATGLEENTTYYYTYGVDGEFSEPAKYQTHSFDSFKFLFISDVQPSPSSSSGDPVEKQTFLWNHSLEVAFDKNDDISFIVNGGDVTNNGADTEEWVAFLSPKKYLNSYPMAATQGNHDKKGTQYKYYFNNPNVYLGVSPTVYGNGYWFRYGDVLFVMINSLKINIFDNYALVKKAVEANPDAKWRIAVTHYDLYGTGHHAVQDETVAVKRALGPVLEHYDFDLALTGHDHIYGRSYFIDDSKVLQTPGYDEGRVVDPQGLMYLTASGSRGNSRLDGEEYNYEWIGMQYRSKNNCYSTIEITDDGKLILESVDTITEEVIDSFEIVKTNSEFKEKENDGGYLGMIIKPLVGEYYVIFEMLGDLFEKIASFFSK